MPLEGWVVVIIPGRERYCLGSQGSYTHTPLVKVPRIQNLVWEAGQLHRAKAGAECTGKDFAVCFGLGFGFGFWPFPFTSFPAQHSWVPPELRRKQRNSCYSTACLYSDSHHVLRDSHILSSRFRLRDSFTPGVLLVLEPESVAARLQPHWEGERRGLGVPEPYVCLWQFPGFIGSRPHRPPALWYPLTCVVPKLSLVWGPQITIPRKMVQMNLFAGQE